MIRLLLPERYCIMKITASRKLRNRMWVVELLQILLGQHQSGCAGILYVRRLKSTFCGTVRQTLVCRQLCKRSANSNKLKFAGLCQ